MLLLLVASSSFVPPTRLGGVAVASAQHRVPQPPVAIGSFFGGGFEALPNDVQFKDVDGDLVTLRPKFGAKAVDFYVGGSLKLSDAKVVQEGNTLKLTGKETKGTPLSLLGFNLEETVTEATTPSNPADIEKAMALVA